MSVLKEVYVGQSNVFVGIISTKELDGKILVE